MSTTAPEPLDDKLLETLNFDLNIAKLATTVMTSSPTSLPAPADLTVLATLINNFFRLDDILSLAPVSEELTTPVNQTEMDIKPKATATADKTLTDIPEETTADNETAMDVHATQIATDLARSCFSVTNITAMKETIPLAMKMKHKIAATKIVTATPLTIEPRVVPLPPACRWMSRQLFPNPHWLQQLEHHC
uniref:Uncharacterized protein n=1 Tax=Romanomermis culicivorax TaxID=13658 RepID=A0A915HHZ5_ROMCU